MKAQFIPITFRNIRFNPSFGLPVLFFLLFFSSCQKEKVSPNSEKLELSNAEAAILNCAGFQLEGAIVTKSSVIVQDDIEIDREAIENIRVENLKAEEIDERQNAVNANFSVDISNVVEIPFFIHSSIGNLPEPWADAIRTAASDWGAITGCAVTFVEVETLIPSGSRGVNFISDAASELLPNPTQLGDFTVARSCAPNGTNPGRFVRLANKNWGLTNIEKINFMRHEIGHTLGFLHAELDEDVNYTATDQCATVWQGINFLHKTTDIDPITTSIMRKQGPINNLTFNAGDIRAAQLLYPDVTPTIGTTLKKVERISYNMYKITANVTYPITTSWYWVEFKLYPPGYLTPITTTVLADNTTLEVLFYVAYPSSGSAALLTAGKNYKKDRTGPSNTPIIFTMPL